MPRTRLTDRIAKTVSLVKELDSIATEVEQVSPRLALELDRVSDALEGRTAAPEVKVDPDALAKAVGLQGWDDVRDQRGGHESSMVSPNQKLSAVPLLIGKIKPLLHNSVDYVNTYMSQKLVPDKQAFNTLAGKFGRPGTSGGDYYWESKSLDDGAQLITALLAIPGLKEANSGCIVSVELKKNSFGAISSVYLCGKPRR